MLTFSFLKFFYDERSASTILNLDARIDGSNEPSRPIPIPKINAHNIKSGVTRKLKAISLKVVKFAVPVEIKFSGRANRIPMATPMIAIATDSRTKAIKILRRRNPSTRSVPISFVLLATAAYIVFIPAKPAPTAIINPIKTARPFNAPEAAPC